MLFHLLYPLRDVIPAFNVFRYITFRVAAAIVTALLLSWLLGPWFIRTLRRLSVGQNIRELGPQTHQVKSGTPTMGGLLILFATLVPTLLWGDLRSVYVWIVVLVTAAYGVIGFLDDYLKIRRGRNLGLTARDKAALQVIAGVGMAVALLYLPVGYGFNPTLTFPFFKQLVLNLGYLYIPFVVLVLVGVSNARQPDRWPRRPGDRRHDGGGGDLRGLYVRGGQPGDLGLSAALLCAGGRRGRGLLRRAGRRRPGLPLVQRPSRRGVHGRRRVAGAGRRDRQRGGDRQAGDPARPRGRAVRAWRRCRS